MIKFRGGLYNEIVKFDCVSICLGPEKGGRWSYSTALCISGPEWRAEHLGHSPSKVEVFPAGVPAGIWTRFEITDDRGRKHVIEIETEKHAAEIEEAIGAAKRMGLMKEGNDYRSGVKG